MTADPGSEAGAAGISARDRVIAKFRPGTDVFGSNFALCTQDVVDLANAHAAAATARAEKAEAELARWKESNTILHCVVKLVIDAWDFGDLDGHEIERCKSAIKKAERAALAEPARREGEGE